MEPEVIYDPQREVAVLIDAGSMRAFGPVYVGPNAEGELLQFMHSMTPRVLSGLSSYDLTDASKEFWAREFAALYAEATAPDTASVGAVGSESGDAAALAAHEATNATSTPPAGPADTDMGADAGTADQVADNGAEPPPATQAARQAMRTVEQNCFACGGSGSVPGAVDGQALVCNLCHGTGRVTQEVPA